MIFFTASAMFLSEKPDMNSRTGLVLRASHRYCRSKFRTIVYSTNVIAWKSIRHGLGIGNSWEFSEISLRNNFKTIKVHSSNSQALPVLLIRTYLKGNYFRGRNKNGKKLRRIEKFKLADNLLNLLWINLWRKKVGHLQTECVGIFVLTFLWKFHYGSGT